MRWLMGAGVAANLGLLAYFKYAGFAAGVGRSLASAAFGLTQKSFGPASPG